MVKVANHRRKLIVGGVTVVAVVAATTSALALTSTSSASYRVATVSRNSVTQSLQTTGSLSPLQAANLDFQVAGTVGRVRVTKGSHVTAGETVAWLDRSALRATLRSAESTLNNAKLTLTSDEASQTSSSSSASTSSPPTGSTSTTKGGTSGTGNTGNTTGTSSVSSHRVSHDQAALLATQHRADLDLTAAKAALAAEKTACANAVSTSACIDATTVLLADQETVSKDQQAVAAAEAALSQALSGSANSTPTTSPTTRATTHTTADTVKRSTQQTVILTASTQPVDQPTGSTGTSQAGQSTGGSVTTVTAATLASDQATIDTDRAAVATARGDLAQAVLRSPIDGTVSAIAISRGDTVSGSSSSTSPAIEIVGSRQSQVAIGLSAAQVRQVKTGMTATVLPDGSSTAVTGQVISIGLTSDSSTSTYPVIISLSPRAARLVSGADAQVTLTLATVHDVIAVPTSAVHRSGTTAYVHVLRNGKLTRVNVKVGAVGAALTEIRSGLTVGELVELADLNAAVPSSSTNLTTRTRGLGGSSSFGGGFTGSGFSGGGGPGSGGFVGPPGAGQ